MSGPLLDFVKLTKTAQSPKKAHPYDAGFDLSADIQEELILEVGERRVISTGIAVQIPLGYYGRLADRSGNAAKYGLHILAGVIDCGYTGEIGVVLVNFGKEPVKIHPSDRIAQLVVTQIFIGTTREVSSLMNNSERGGAGFGSTGK